MLPTLRTLRARAPACLPRVALRGLATAPSPPTTRVLVTGATGQIGMELVALLRARLGGRADALVLASDIKGSSAELQGCAFETLDVTDEARLRALCEAHRIDTVVHLASLLSATGEKNPELAMHVNRGGAEAVLKTARALRLKVFAPSTIAAFGPSTPADDTPDLTIMRPTTMYGVTKVYLELLGEYYAAKFGVDFRSVRYPGIISHLALPGGGTTDYAVEIFYEALKQRRYTCFLGPQSSLPMMYMPDCIAGTVRLMEAPRESLSTCVYNVTGCSFTPADMAVELQRVMPDFTMDYKPDFRQAIADSWPASIDDSLARKDWGWKHAYGLPEMTSDMLSALSVRLGLPITRQ